MCVRPGTCAATHVSICVQGSMWSCTCDCARWLCVYACMCALRELYDTLVQLCAGGPAWSCAKVSACTWDGALWPGRVKGRTP